MRSGMRMGFIRTCSKFMEKSSCSLLQWKQPRSWILSTKLYYTRLGTNITESTLDSVYSHRNLKDLCLRASEIVCSRLQSCLASDSAIKLCWFTIVRTFLPVSYIFDIQSVVLLNPSYWTAGVQLHAPQGDCCSMGGLWASPKLSSCWYTSPGSGSPLQALGPILK